jgi:hypothetical protein
MEAGLHLRAPALMAGRDARAPSFRARTSEQRYNLDIYRDANRHTSLPDFIEKSAPDKE